MIAAMSTKTPTYLIKPNWTQSQTQMRMIMRKINNMSSITSWGETNQQQAIDCPNFDNLRIAGSRDRQAYRYCTSTYNTK